MNQHILRAAAIVVAFWWLVLAGWQVTQDGSSWGEAWHASAAVVSLTVAGAIIGFAGIWAWIWSQKAAQRALMQHDAVRGLTCTIGEVPLIAGELVQAGTLPDLAHVPDVPPDFYPKWFARFENTHPDHVALMKALLRVYEAVKHLPATHIPNGHGGRSLLEHSVLAGYIMDKIAGSWEYKGLRDRSGKRVVLKLRDPDYRFNPTDPLVALIGVAHDIGKIEAYIFSRDGKIVGISHEHDLTGARMIARMSEAWAIPDVDRTAMFLAIAHYHHPMELPLSPDRRAIDDRTIALMELLIKTDFVASKVESNGKAPTEAEAEYEEAGPAASAEVTVDQVYQAFVDLINEHGRVNSSDPRFNVATLCLGEGFEKPMLMVKEDAVRPALLKRLGLPSSHPEGDGRHKLSIQLLEALDRQGILYRKHEGMEFSAQNSLWYIDFMTRPANGARPEKKTGWSAVIVVDPKAFPKIEQMEPYWWFAVIQRSTTGSARAINKRRGVSGARPTIGEPHEAFAGQAAAVTSTSPTTTQTGVAAPLVSAGSAGDVDVASPDTTDIESPSTDPRPAAAAALLAEIWSEEDAPQASTSVPSLGNPGGGDFAAPGAADDQDATGVPEIDASVLLEDKHDADGRRRNIAPIHVRQALNRVIDEATKHNLKLSEMAGRLMASNATLTRFAPEIDWDSAQYKLDQMAKAGTLDVWVLPQANGEGYVVVFADERDVGSSGSERLDLVVDEQEDDRSGP